MIYSIFGGTPFYYALMRKLALKGDIKNIIGEMFFNPYAPLKDEVRNILTLEFGGTKDIYYSILEAISLGHSRASEIGQYLGYRSTSLSPYIDDLLNYYEYIERKVPATMKISRKTKITRYAIVDPLMLFWFKFIYRHMGELEVGMYDYIIKNTLAELNIYIGKRMEDIIKELLILVHKNILHIEINRIGNWWNRSGSEIDLVAIDDNNKNILFCEIKWRNKKAGFDVVSELIQKTNLIKEYQNYSKSLLVVSKSGFSTTALSLMDEKTIHHWNLKDIEDMLKKIIIN